MIKVDLLTESKESAYEKFLGNVKFSSPQHSLRWRDFVCSLGMDVPYFVIAESDGSIVGALPLYYYKGRFGNLLTTNAWHTISGIICSDDGNKRDIYKSLLDYSLNLAKELDCAVLSIGTNPFLNDIAYYKEYFQPDYMLENFIQYFYLSEIFDDKGNFVHPNYTKRTNLSRNLRKAKQQQLIISDVQSEDNVYECFEIQDKRMRELGTTPFPLSFFYNALKILTLKGEGKFVFAFSGEKMIAGSLFLFNRNMMNIYMMCMDSDYKEFGTNYLLTDYMLRFGYEKGVSIFNWMSSPRKGDGVYRWKEQWGSRERSFWYLTRVLGDISQWRSISLKELMEAYSFHYVLPFNLLATPEKRFTTKNELAFFIKSIL